MNWTGLGSNPNAAVLIDGDEVARMIVGEKFVTDAGVNLFDIPLATLQTFAAKLEWSVTCNDGTDPQVFTGSSTIAAANKAGVFTSSVITLAGIQATASAVGTLTAAVTVVTGAGKITIIFTPTGSLTELPGTYRLSYTLINLSKQQINVL